MLMEMRWHGPGQLPFRVRVLRFSGRKKEKGALSGRGVRTFGPSSHNGGGSGSIDSLLRLAVDRAIPWLKK